MSKTLTTRYTYTEGPEAMRYPSVTRRQVIGETFAGRKSLEDAPDERNPFAMFGPPTTETPRPGMKIPGMPYTERLNDEDPDPGEYW